MPGKAPFETIVEEVKPDRVVRLNRTFIIVAVLVLAGLFALVLAWGSSPPTTGETQMLNAQDAPTRTGVTPTATLQLPKSYGDVVEIIDPPEDGPVEAQNATLRAPETRIVRVVEPSPIDADQVAQLLRQVEAIQQANERANQTAFRAPIMFAGSSTGSGASGATPPPGTIAVNGRHPFNGFSTTPGSLGNRAKNSGGGGGFNGPASGVLVNGQGGANESQKEFAARGNGTVKPVLGQRLIRPVDPYTLQVGHSIAAALITEINTDLPGRIIAQTTEPVFDSVTGQHLLIPQGSKLLGSYDSLIDNGQDRALLVWERLILPNGKSILLDAMLGTDPTGAAGKKDRVDFHTGRLIGGVLLSTAISYGANSARDRSDDSDVDLIGDSVAQESTRIGSKIVDRILDIEPTIKIRQGARVRVLVEEDIVLEPYRR